MCFLICWGWNIFCYLDSILDMIDGIINQVLSGIYSIGNKFFGFILNIIKKIRWFFGKKWFDSSWWADSIWCKHALSEVLPVERIRD